MNPEEKPTFQSAIAPLTPPQAPASSSTTTPAPTTPPSPIIRTYESDVANAVKQRHSSVASIAMAESRTSSIGSQSTEAEQTSGSTGKKILFFLIGLTLIAGGAWGGYYFYSQSVIAKNPPTSTAPKTISSIFTANSQKLVDIETVSAIKITSTITSTPIPEGGMIEFIFTKAVEGGKVRATPQEFLSKIGLTIPDNLSRSLTASWMAGIYHPYGATDQPVANSAFVVLTTDFFQNAFSGMLKWEPTMADDIASLLPKAPAPATGSDENSPSIQEFFSIQGTFEDSVIKSKDVRSFKDNTGKILLVYSFIDQKTLVITQNEDTLREIMARIEKRAYIR